MARVPTTRVVPVQNIVQSNDDGVHLNSTPVEIFAVENELNVFPSQQERSIFAEAVFGDISSFLHNSNECHEWPLAQDGSTNEENGVESSVVGVGGLPHCVESSNDVTIEIPQLSENEEVLDETSAGQLEPDLLASLTGAESSLSEHVDYHTIEVPQLPENDEEFGQTSAEQQETDDCVSEETSNSVSGGKYKPSVYIHSHIEMMYLCGTCNYRTFTQNESKGHESYWSRIISWIHTTCFAGIAVLAILHTFFDAKYFLMCFLAGAGLNTLVKLTFSLISLVSCVYAAYMFGRKGTKISKMVDDMNKYEVNWEGKPPKRKISYVLATFTFVFAAIKAVWIIDLDDISMKNVLLENSLELSEDLFEWNSQDQNKTFQQLENDYGKSLNSVTITMGLFFGIRNFATILFQGMIWDIFANIVLTLMCYMMHFITFVHLVMENIPDENTEQAKQLKQQRAIVWTMYREIQKVIAVVNDVFHQLLMLFHYTNVLRYAFFLERVMYPDGETAFTYVHLIYDIVRSEAIYVTAAKIAKENSVIRQWIRTWALHTGKIDLGYMRMDANMVMDEVKEDPIGLGRRDHLINQGFHHGLLGRVISLFVILANKTGESP